MKRLYFDYNATAPLQSGFLAHFENLQKLGFANPSSSHSEGQHARKLVEQARRMVLNGLDAADYNLVFTSGATEANNQVMHSLWRDRGDRSTILLTEVEHSCVYNTALALQAQGAKLEWIRCDRFGNLDIEDFRSKLSPDVIFVSVMLVQNETGFVFPVKDIVREAHAHSVPVLCDVVCAVAKIPVSLKNLGCDYATFSSHKFGALQGCGGVLYHKNAKLNSFITGGPQERDKRAGTENMAGIVSTGYALERALQKMPTYHETAVRNREKLVAGIQSIHSRSVVLQSTNQIHQTLNVSLVGLDGQVLLTNLDLEGVAVSFGSACSSGSLELSRALLKTGLTMEEARSALRLSFGPEMTEVDVTDFLQRLGRVVSRMKSNV